MCVSCSYSYTFTPIPYLFDTVWYIGMTSLKLKSVYFVNTLPSFENIIFGCLWDRQILLHPHPPATPTLFHDCWGGVGACLWGEKWCSLVLLMAIHQLTDNVSLQKLRVSMKQVVVCKLHLFGLMTLIGMMISSVILYTYNMAELLCVWVSVLLWTTNKVAKCKLHAGNRSCSLLRWAERWACKQWMICSSQGVRVLFKSQVTLGGRLDSRDRFVIK